MSKIHVQFTFHPQIRKTRRKAWRIWCLFIGQLYYFVCVYIYIYIYIYIIWSFENHHLHLSPKRFFCFYTVFFNIYFKSVLVIVVHETKEKKGEMWPWQVAYFFIIIYIFFLYFFIIWVPLEYMIYMMYIIYIYSCSCLAVLGHSTLTRTPLWWSSFEDRRLQWSSSWRCGCSLGRQVRLRWTDTKASWWCKESFCLGEQKMFNSCLPIRIWSHDLM